MQYVKSEKSMKCHPQMTWECNLRKVASASLESRVTAMRNCAPTNGQTTQVRGPQVEQNLNFLFHSAMPLPSTVYEVRQ